MALGDLMVSRFSQSPLAGTNHLDECLRQNETEDIKGSNYGDSAAMPSFSMAYFPPGVFLCGPENDDFEAYAGKSPAENGLVSKWRPKDRMKTSCVGLVLCLNINVDPPDVIRISPCARMECWIDPFSMVAPKALEIIGKALTSQYERWQPRARYKIELDPTVEAVKKLCTSNRKLAKSERVLFHYNGHGVPKPTANGEIWLLNKSYTQYIPLRIIDLDSWMKTPSIYVFDCSSAGMIVNAFIQLHDLNTSAAGTPRDCILLAACEAHETLPQSDEFPADVFTSCLTTPIKMALKWFRRRSLLHDFLDDNDIDRIPGLQNDRKTLLGELNWIFTAVTDTIAWNVLPRDLFQRLFRQDLLVASLFRNFLLADRIMRSANCSPISHPILPPTHQHHMWDAWDMAAEICLSRLPSLRNDPYAELQPSPFFTEQLLAFEIWLDHGSEHKKRPEQLPIVLQVLLSQCHRYQALLLLGRFFDMGSWAVDQALSVGIFPYVLKLLQTTTPELRQLLVFIWTKILALDKSCQVDLVKDGGHKYFIRFLDSAEAYTEQRTMAAFVLAVIVDGHKRGQEACFESGLLQVCLRHIECSSPDDGPTESLFVQWACLCLGKLWENFTEAQILGLQTHSPAVIATLLVYPQPEVRASAVFTLGTLLDVGFDSLRDNIGEEEFVDDDIEVEATIVKSLLSVISDGSPLVRAEIAVALSQFALVHKKHLKLIAAAYLKPQSNSLMNTLPSVVYSKSLSSGFTEQSTLYHSHISNEIMSSSDQKKVMSVERMTTRSSPGAASKMLLGSPLSDDSSQNSDSGIMNEHLLAGDSNAKPRALDNATYSQVVSAMRALAKDPSPYVANLGRQVLSMIGVEKVVTKPLMSTVNSFRPVESSPISANRSLAGLVRSSSWFDMNGGHMPLTFRTPPVSPPRPAFPQGMHRVSSLEFRPHILGSPEAGLADSLPGGGSAQPQEHNLLPQSTIYNWSCGHFSKPLLAEADDSEELLARRREREKLATDHIVKCQHSGIRKFNESIARLDTKFEQGTRANLMHPFSPIVIVADESECIRVWNYEEATLLNGFENHHYPSKGVSKLCLVNELDDSLLLVASSDGNIRLWKDYCAKGKQKLVTAFSSIQGHRPGVRSLNPVVDWQQVSGYLFASGEISSIVTWSLEKGQLVNTLPSPTDCSISALSASPVHGGQLATGYVDATVRLFDVRAQKSLVYVASPHTQKVEKVVGLGFQPGLDPVKIMSASEAGDIQVFDLRYGKETYFSFEAHKGSLTTFAVHRHAPIVASGSARQLIKVFSLDGDLLGSMQNSPIFMPQKLGPLSCLAFHPYQKLLAAGATDPFVSIFADDKYQSR